MSNEDQGVAALQAADAATEGRLPALVQPWSTQIAEGAYAVQLNDDVDWELVAAWVGGEVVNTRDHSDEYSSSLVIPRPSGSYQEAYEGWWVIRNLAGGRHVASPGFIESLGKSRSQDAAQPPTSEASPHE